MTDADTARYLRHLVEAEGVPASEAKDFLDILAIAETEDPAFHAGFVAGLDERVERAAAAVAAAALARIAQARETRVGPRDARSLAEGARRAAEAVVACRGGS